MTEKYNVYLDDLRATPDGFQIRTYTYEETIQVLEKMEGFIGVAGNIDADVTVNFPADYFLPKARLTVTPVLKYQGGEVAGAPFEYQGQKVTENYKMVSKDGAAIREHVNFKYVPGMEKSELVARAKVLYKGKT